MTHEQAVIKLMGFSRNTYYVWKREDRPIIKLLDQFKDDLEEFLKSGKISKYDQFTQYSFNISFQYFDFLIPLLNDFVSLSVYFDFLNYTKETIYQDNLFKSGVIDIDFVKKLTFKFYSDSNSDQSTETFDEDILSNIISTDSSLLMFIISSFNSNFDIFHNELLSGKLPFNYTMEQFKYFKLLHECFYLVSKNENTYIHDLPKYLNQFINDLENKYENELIEDDIELELISLFTKLNEALIKNEIDDLADFFDKLN